MTSLISEFGYLLRKLNEIEKHFKVHTLSPNEKKVLKMANDQSFGKLGGRTVDALSAGLFKGVYEKAPQNAKDKINKMNEKQLYVFMTKLWSKFGKQVRLGS